VTGDAARIRTAEDGEAVANATFIVPYA